MSVIDNSMADIKNNSTVMGISSNTNIFGITSQKKNFDLTAPVLAESFDTISQFVGGNAAGASGSIAANTTLVREGVASLAITATNGGYYGTKIISLDCSQEWVWGVAVYVGSITGIVNLTIYLSSSATLASYFSHIISVSRLHVGWNVINIAPSEWSNTGGESWSNTMIRLRVRLSSNVSVTANVIFDGLYRSVNSRSKVMVVFDDNWDSAYTQGYLYMLSKGMVGTQYVISSYVNQPGRMTIGQLNECQDNGWCIANHTATHVNLASLPDQASVESELVICRDFLRINGFNSPLDVAYPNGAYDDKVLSAMDSLSMLSGSTVTPLYEATFSGVAERYLIGRHSVNNVDSLATMKNVIDTAIAKKTSVIILFHKIVASPSVSTEWSITNFRELIDYISSKASQIDPITMSEWRTRMQVAPLDISNS